MNAAPKRDALERILQLAVYLRDARPGRTLEQICADIPGYRDNDWESARKKLRRDLADLHDHFGVDAHFDDSTKTYRLAAPFFTDDERHALIAAAELVRIDGIEDNPELVELGRAVDADGARVVVRVDEHLLALRDAIASRTSVHFRYHGRDRTIDPYAVGLWHDHWYVVGFDHDRAERRIYRLDRIEPATPAISMVGKAHGFEIDADANPASMLLVDPNTWGRDEPYSARILVDDDYVSGFRDQLGGDLVEHVDGRAVIALTVRHHQYFRDRLWFFGEHAVVVEPPELRALLRAWLEELAR